MFAQVDWDLVHPLVLSIPVSAVILTPPFTFVWVGQARRYREIEAQFSLDGMRQYLRMFHRDETASTRDDANVRKVFRDKFDEHIGRKLQCFMLALLGILVLVSVAWVILTVFLSLLDTQLAALPKLPPIALASLCGALLWVSTENLRHWSSYTFSRVAFARASARIVFSVPLGYAITAPLGDEAAPFFALLVGWFPMSAIQSWGRRVLEERVPMLSAPKYEDGTSVLLSVDPHVAEELEAVGVNTIFELAYQDPVQLSARTGLDFVPVVEHMGQALLARYLRQEMVKLRPLGLLGAQEVYNLCNVLRDTAPTDAKAASEAVLAEAARALSIDPRALYNTFEEVAQDPFTKFFATLWRETDEANDERSLRPPSHQAPGDVAVSRDAASDPSIVATADPLAAPPAS